IGKQTALDRRAVRITPRHFSTLRLVNEVIQSQPERNRSIGSRNFTELIEEFGLPIRSKPHHLVLIAEFPESEVLSQSGVIHAERMRKCNLAQRTQLRAFANSIHRARKIAQTINGENSGVFKRRAEARTGEVRRMMLDSVILSADRLKRQIECLRDLFLYAREFLHHANAIKGESRHPHCKSGFCCKPCQWIARHRYVVDLG